MLLLRKSKAIPLHGQYRLKRRFAWKRTKVRQGYVWLKWYTVEEKFFQPVNGYAGWWSEVSRDA